MGFYLVLKGRADLVFEVVKVRRLDLIDSSQETNARLMRQIRLYGGGHEEHEAEFEGTLQDQYSASNNSYQAVSKPHHVKLAYEVKPEPKPEEDNVFPTSIGLADDREGKDGDQPAESDPGIEKMRHYETTTAKVTLHDGEGVSSLNIDKLRIKDFDAYYQEYYKDLVENKFINKLPESLSWPVDHYKDTAVTIDAIDAHTVLLYVPEIHFRMISKSSTRELRHLERFFYEALPSFKEYTASYMNRLLPCFEEKCFEQH